MAPLPQLRGAAGIREAERSDRSTGQVGASTSYNGRMHRML